MMRFRVGLLSLFALVFVIAVVGWKQVHRIRHATSLPPSSSATPRAKANYDDPSTTKVFAHNLLLRKGPNFRVYVRWLSGQMVRSQRKTNPSFDDPDSFSLDIRTGVLRANIGDLSNYLNTGIPNSPVTNIQLSGAGDQIRLRGTVHKVVPLPIEMVGTLSATPDSRIQVHVTKLNVMKVPFKTMLGAIHVSVADLLGNRKIDGLQVSENDLFFDTHTLLPPPHMRGHLTKVRIENPDLEEVFGDAQEEVDRVEQWRNFLRLRGGTLNFGKLTMNSVDLIMIDISKDPWFDLDLTNYQKQLTNGYTRVTRDSGLQIFMPDLRDIPPKKTEIDDNIEWFKNRNIPPPPQFNPNGR